MANHLMLSPTEKISFEKLGAWLTYWYPSDPKTFGLYFLRDFLEKNNAWEAFIKNYHTLGKREHFANYFEYIMYSKDLTSIIDWSFNWVESKEGMSFWKDIDKRFRSFLKDREKEGYNLKEICHDPNVFHKHKAKNITTNKIKKGVSKINTILENSDYMTSIYSLLSGTTKMINNMTEKWSRPTSKVTINIPLTKSTIMEFKTIDKDD